jgi:2-hydroxychromene-2-carboxylate isomerase
VETVKFYYDYKSPFTFLAFEPACALEQTHRISLRFLPVDLDIRGVFHGEPEQRPEREKRKVRYMYADARRFANQRGLVLRGPQKIFDSRLALLSGLFADRKGLFRPYSQRVFERFFKRELDIEDPAALGRLMTEVGLDPEEFKRYADGPAREEFAAAAAEAESDAIFGVPTLIVDGEPFWGNDRIDWVIKKLDAMGLKR